MVAQFQATTTSYPVPTASISGVSELKGKTVFYIPLDSIPLDALNTAQWSTSPARSPTG